MFKFACFTSPNDKQRSKNTQNVRSIVRSNSRGKTKDQEIKVPSGSARRKTKTDGNNLSNKSIQKRTSQSPQEDRWKSDDFVNDFCPEDYEEFNPSTNMKRSQSLGCVLDKEGDLFDDDDGIDGVFSFNHSHENNKTRRNGSFYDITSSELYDRENVESSFHNQFEDNVFVRHESLFPSDDLQEFYGGRHADVDEQYADRVSESGSDMPPGIGRSQSVNNLGVDTDEVMGLRCRSFENLHPKEFDLDKVGSAFHIESEEKYLVPFDGYDPCNYNMVAKVGNELNIDDVKLKNIKKESPVLNCDEQVDPKELSMRRIQDWFSQFNDVSDCIVQEPGETSTSFSSKEPQVGGDSLVDPTAKPDARSRLGMEVAGDSLVDPTAKPDARSRLGMEVAYNYISSLTPTSSTAQMSNLGLVAVPLLSSFVGLRVLNLSGNSIVHITAGAFPRGIHTLNLSKNNIAIIEGLHELTRLRVLDLSYNRISKIGNGLASCSSLKELYLAGNMISDVEGLHRLLKLNILDLRSNKISTAKGLSQLAANHNSLQAINLDGNPAQRNVGDEQLKKYLLSILPNLVYYNKHNIRGSGNTGKKEVMELPPRSPSHSGRRENKLTQRGSHGSGLNKLSLNPIRPSPANAMGSLLRQPKGRLVESPLAHLPPVGSKLPYLLPEVDKKQTSPTPKEEWKPKDQWAAMVSMGLGGSMAAVLGQPR